MTDLLAIATIDARSGDMVRGDDAWQRHRRIVNLRNRAQETFLELGEELYWFEEKKQYKMMGYDTFEAYLADPEVDIGRSTAFRLKGVYETFQLKLKSPTAGLLEAGDAKLDVIRPYVTPDNVDGWVSRAASLSRSDLRSEINEAFPQNQVWEQPPPQPTLLYDGPAELNEYTDHWSADLPTGVGVRAWPGMKVRVKIWEAE